MANHTTAAPTAILGGIPTVSVDVPILAVFIALFVSLAAAHMTILQTNNRAGHKFLISGALFGFCMSRIMASVMRIVWATQPGNSSVVIVAQIFNNAGILLVYVVNNVLAQRMLRAAVPALGWHRVFRTAHKVLLFLVVPVLVMVIVTIVQTLRGADAATRSVDVAIQHAGLTYITVIAVLPLLLLPVAVFWPRAQPLDKFGSGSWHAKVVLLFLTTCVACVEAGFRAGTAWEAPRLATDPAWFDSKPAYYCFGFMLDVILAALFLVGRVDRRFHVPNKADGPGSYSADPASTAAAADSSSEEEGRKQSWAEKESR